MRGALRDTSAMAIGIWVIAGVAIVFLLRAASQLFIPVVLAVLISYALEPVVAWMHRRHVRIATDSVEFSGGQFMRYILAAAAQASVPHAGRGESRDDWS